MVCGFRPTSPIFLAPLFLESRQIERLLFCVEHPPSPVFQAVQVVYFPDLRPDQAWELLLLEPVTRELQRPAVLSHRAHNMIRRPIRYLGLHLDSHCHRCPDQAGEVSDDFIGN